MKIIFAGTPDFAAQALEALLTAGHEIALVLTQPDRPAGRGMKLAPSAVKLMAQKHNIPVWQPEKLRTTEQQAPVMAAQADVMIVAAYGIILPQIVLDAPRYGCLNIHASLLPRWRGAAPIQRAILAGDTETGVTIMQMDAGLDTGNILSMRAIPIAQHTASTLHDQLATLGATMIVDTLAQLPEQQAQQQPQPQEGILYADKLKKEEALIDWTQPAECIARKIRAFNPFPSAQTTLEGNPLKIWGAEPAAGHGLPGQILVAHKAELIVACGQGALKLTELQKSGSKRMPVAAFLSGQALQVGGQLGV